MTFQVGCGACKETFKAEFLEPAESRYARCPHCGAPTWLEVKQKTIAEPRKFINLPGMRQ